MLRTYVGAGGRLVVILAAASASVVPAMDTQQQPNCRATRLAIIRRSNKQSGIFAVRHWVGRDTLKST